MWALILPYSTGLAKEIILAVGSRVMYLVNSKTIPGLVNGARGTVLSFSYAKNKRTVSSVTVQFDGMAEPQCVSKIDKMFMPLNGCYVHRQQFPLVLAYAVTIHKSQSLSLPCVFADLGDGIFCAGQSNVALSRCKTLEGLHLLNFNPKRVYCSTKAVNHQSKLLGVDLTYNKSEKGLKSLERVWYTRAAVHLAKRAMKSDLKNDADTGNKEESKATPKSDSKRGTAKKNRNTSTRKPTCKANAQPKQAATVKVDNVIDVDAIPEEGENRIVPILEFQYYPVNSAWQMMVCRAFGWTYVEPSAPQSDDYPVTVDQFARPVVQVSFNFTLALFNRLSFIPTI